MIGMKQLLSIICLALVLFSASSCCKNEEPSRIRPVKRTVAFYMVSENSLIGFDSFDISELLEADSLLMDNDEIVIYLDNNVAPAIYTITNKTKGRLLSDLTPEYQYPSEQNSCTGQALTEFLNYVRQFHSADSYGLVMWSHGQGWIPSVYEGDSQKFSKRRSFGIDNGENSNSNTGNQMCISDLHSALQTMGQQFDYIFFDCCFMQCIEVAYELKDVAKYIIASPAEIPAYGADYKNIMTYLFETTGFEKDIPSRYYQDYINDTTYGVIISTVDCSQLSQLADATRSIIGDHSTLLNASYGNVFDYFQYDLYRFRAVSYPDFYDMNGIMKTIFPEQYNTWKQAFDKAVPYAYATKTWYSILPTLLQDRYRKVDRDQFGGVSMYVPLEKYTQNEYFWKTDKYFFEGYYESQWSKDVWQ